MTISKGADWGEVVSRPDDLRVAHSDHELARMLGDGTGRPTAVDAGDVHRTINARPLADREELLALPFDLLHVTLDDAEPFVTVAHALARSAWRSGGWLCGEALAVMNAEFVGDFDVAPRGHPNDGRVETFRVGPEVSMRQRWEVRRRLPSAQHLPHPLISVRPVRSTSWEFDRPRVIIADGHDLGLAHRLAIDVEADAAVVYA